MSTPAKVFVTGATGMQGGAVARALLAKGHPVRAFVRDPSGERAQALVGLGAELAQGDFDTPESVAHGARGCHAIFVLGTPFEAGVDTETRQAIAAIDAARSADVAHIVYSSVANADQHTGIPHFESKRRVEEHLERVTRAYTIVAPVNFRENFTGAGRDGIFAMPLPADRALQTISSPEMGAFVAAVVARGQALFGARIDLGSDASTGPQMAAAISHAAHRPIRYNALPLTDDDGDMTRMYRWFDTVGYSADIAKLRSTYPDVAWSTFAGWALQQRW